MESPSPVPTMLPASLCQLHGEFSGKLNYELNEGEREEKMSAEWAEPCRTLVLRLSCLFSFRETLAPLCTPTPKCDQIGVLSAKDWMESHPNTGTSNTELVLQLAPHTWGTAGTYRMT